MKLQRKKSIKSEKKHDNNKENHKNTKTEDLSEIFYI